MIFHTYYIYLTFIDEYKINKNIKISLSNFEPVDEDMQTHQQLFFHNFAWHRLYLYGRLVVI